jgi:hypothetical protein
MVQLAQLLVEKSEQQRGAAAVEAATHPLPAIARPARQPPQRAHAPRHAPLLAHPRHELAQLLRGETEPGGPCFWAGASRLGGRPARRPSASPASPRSCQARRQAGTVA